MLLPARSVWSDKLGCVRSEAGPSHRHRGVPTSTRSVRTLPPRSLHLLLPLSPHPWGLADVLHHGAVLPGLAWTTGAGRTCTLGTPHRPVVYLVPPRPPCTFFSLLLSLPPHPWGLRRRALSWGRGVWTRMDDGSRTDLQPAPPFPNKVSSYVRNLRQALMSEPSSLHQSLSTSLGSGDRRGVSPSPPLPLSPPSRSV